MHQWSDKKRDLSLTDIWTNVRLYMQDGRKHGWRRADGQTARPHFAYCPGPGARRHTHVETPVRFTPGAVNLDRSNAEGGYNCAVCVKHRSTTDVVPIAVMALPLMIF